MVKISSLETKLEELQKTSVTAAPDAQKDKGEATKESAKVTEKSKDTSQTKKVYLTFDDGPGIESDKILDVLKDEGVQATFFVNGKDDDYSKKVYKRIVNEGHTLGMHSFS
ncbi:MAG: polysaccharide deacetylase family protein, partial [Eubacterium sp.]|nr:polysaccharide deacetylase family protein [Eubacterium sp.]